jgi:hypothetical protein
MANYYKTSLGKAAFIAGFAILISAIAAPIAEFSIYPMLVVPGKAEETTKNIIANANLFRAGIFCYMLTFICDVVIAWGLYILLKPVNENLSMLTAWLRLIYTIMAAVALVNLVVVARLLNTSNNLTTLSPDQLYAQVKISLTAFRSGWSFSFVFFSIHLGLLGYLIIRSKYIPSILGILLIITGLGWLIGNLQPILFPQFTINSTIINIAGSFELIFMLWLLIKGARIKEAY